MLKVGLSAAPTGSNHKQRVFAVALSRFYATLPFLPWCPAPVSDVERAALYLHVSPEYSQEEGGWGDMECEVCVCVWGGGGGGGAGKFCSDEEKTVVFS